MKANVGGIDRILRGVVGAALILAGLLAGIAEPWNWVAVGAGAVFVLTSLIKFCPLYPLLGFNTCGKQ
ncbi:MAG: DUF2892 domain-containing protein [Zetaproteobacteria bacterium CG_4_9_14_3_um_filter_49_83]|nr:MAG: hypothetical protein AUJ56_12895 [Zetaproteobacteria bacterium CG1_02_49_23]PIQ30899.1 MAG: hypothetical protein COW62_11010 [Zetaproteobacteria bacterium CG17_big_fil_post_rev_8_21_14_2_50_50_13]PIV30826.1 MAG: DUF2892 domain-containing protein [Zetaproteobacteria bacterium CG02_land_8_20_14_3_00_50_9]PIY56218.1 MAG: DUF2892 domain-containing protein [Zetaproteobacteria bacterium CG_4_10_14_0_8_um_filter_49_80]PJA34701.1 MAG: DUF2892 domain-containing protein [Zetaproteobacteria bacter